MHVVKFDERNSRVAVFIIHGHVFFVVGSKLKYVGHVNYTYTR